MAGNKLSVKVVAAYLTETEYAQFEAAAKKTNQEIGQAVKFACMFWARIAGGEDEDHSSGRYQGENSQENTHL